VDGILKSKMCGCKVLAYGLVLGHLHNAFAADCVYALIYVFALCSYERTRAHRILASKIGDGMHHIL